MSQTHTTSHTPEPLPAVVSTAVTAAQDAKAFDLTILDISEVFSLSDHFIIASGRSDRHVQGIAQRIRSTLADVGVKPLAVEGLDRGHWVLLDYGDLLVHVFYHGEREKYSLESLWMGAKELPVPEEDENVAA